MANILISGETMEAEPIMITVEKLASFIETLVNFFGERKRKKVENENALKQVIYVQRCLPTICKGDYDHEEIANHERRIIAFLETYFPGEVAEAFSKNTVDIFWALRDCAEIKELVVEQSLEEFIKACNSKGYRVS